MTEVERLQKRIDELEAENAALRRENAELSVLRQKIALLEGQINSIYSVAKEGTAKSGIPDKA